LAVAAAVVVGCGGCFGGARGPVQGDVLLVQLNAAARAAFARGQVEQAQTFYDRALQRARAADDPSAIAGAAYDSAVCLVRLRQPQRAERLLVEAQRESARAGLGAGDILLVRARIAESEGRAAEAVSLADEVLAERHGAVKANQRLEAFVVKGLAALEAGDVRSASDALVRARAEGRRTDDAGALAGVMLLAARIDERSGRPADAARSYDAQADLLRRSALYADMVDALRRSAEAYRAAGMTAAAADRFYRAARSAAAQGDGAAARRIAGMAAGAAADAGDRALGALVVTLLEELAPATQPAAP
jgi:tetratricopeptide (TPR) repeat protein